MTARPENRLRPGVIGLGMIGAGVAVSLAASGRPPAAVYDVRREAAEQLSGVPGVAASPAVVAQQCDVVLVAVTTGQQARDALDGPQGLLTSVRPGQVVVLLSTVGVEIVRELAALCAVHDVTLIDAGVTGGSQAATKGLVTMVGGPDDVVAKVMPVLEDFSQAVVHCGPLGAGMVTKLARNAITYSVWAAVREASSLAVAGGVDPATLVEVIEASAASVPALLHLQLLAAGHTLEEEQVDWATGLAEKDLAAAQELAAEVGIEVPIADLTRPRIRQVYAGELDEPMPQDDRARGRVMMDRTYGGGFSELITDDGLASPSLQHTLDHLFANVWARPFLPLRDRRLLTIGATTMLGRADLLETQLRGAVAAGELTTDQIRELALHLHYYAGWGNGTLLMRIAETLVAEREAANGA